MTAHPRKVGWGLLIGALGIVYGDIGTSPLYAISEAFFGHYDLARTPENILGVMSLVFWSLTLVVTLKYILLILRADNNGEGGIFALLGLLLKKERGQGGSAPAATPGWTRAALVSSIVIGAALLYGDGIITPAISVLSAVEGLSVVTPAAESLLIPITLGILVALFAVQRHGTHRIGVVFGPFMAIWFLAIAALGLVQIVAHPQVLAGLSPHYAVALAREHGWNVLFILGAVVLCVTGVEALYADLGHFGRGAIRRSWMLFVFPCLLANYLGQGAYLLSGAAIPRNHLFYALVPAPFLIPMVILATGATIIASQALISGVFSLTQQAIALGLFPRLRVVHTNPSVRGQIYVPFVNAMLLVGCLWLVVSFRTSGALAAAYGIAVTGTMSITTIAFALVARSVFGWRLRALLPLVALILVVDLGFFGANLLKFAAGGYVPVVIALAIFAVMDTWRWGRAWVGRAYAERLKDVHMTLQALVEEKPRYLDAHASVSLVVMASRPMTGMSDTVPPVLSVHYRNWKRLPKHIIFLSIQQLGQPFVPADARYQAKVYTADEHGTVVAVQACYGYMESPNVREALLDLKKSRMVKIPQDPARWLILLGAERFVSRGKTRRERLRLGVFSRLNRLAKPVTDYFGLEYDSAVAVEMINV